MPKRLLILLVLFLGFSVSLAPSRPGNRISGADDPAGFHLWTLAEAAVLTGDINGDLTVNLADAVVGLQVLTGAPPAGVTGVADVNNDALLGQAEVIYALQVAAGLTPGLDPTEVAAIRQEIVAMLLALAGSQQQVDDMTEVYQVLAQTVDFEQLAQVASLQEARALLTTGFSCGTVEVKVNEFTFTFEEEAACDFIEGEVIVIPGYDAGTKTITLAIEFHNLDLPTCRIDGLATLTLNKDGDLLTLVLVCNNLAVCDRVYTGAVTMVATATGELLSVSLSLQSTYTLADNSQYAVAAEIIYTPATGLSGTGVITGDDNVPHTVTFSEITFDATCGLPNHGTMTIDAEITLDFSTTTCENQTVAVTYHGVTFTVDLAEAVALIAGL